MEFILKNKPTVKSRYTIGYLDENGNDEYHGYITEGIYEAARKYNANVVRFGHFTSNTTYKHDFQINMVLEYIEQFNLDGLIFLGWARAVTQDNHESFKNRFSRIPILSLGAGYQDIPNVYFPGDMYTREILEHLINIHQCRNIAFIAPFWPDNRSDVYTNTMKEYGIYNPDLFISADLIANLEVPQRGRKAVSILLDQRKVPIDAVVSLFNAETEGIMVELALRGIRVPDDIKVTSYEDGEVGKFHSPSFTTVYFPWKELGFNACEKLITLIRKGRVPLSTMVKGKVIVRDSCGCMSNSVNIAKDCNFRIDSGLRQDLSKDEVNDIKEQMESIFSGRNLNFEKIIEALLEDLKNRSQDCFLNEMDYQMKQFPNHYNYEGIEDMVSILRNVMLPKISGSIEGVLWAEELFQQGQVYLRNKATSAWAYRELQSKLVNENLQEISQILITKFSIQSLMDSLEENLPKLNIKSCYIFIFKNREGLGNIFDNCSLVFEYSDNIRIRKNENCIANASSKLQEILFPLDRPYGMMANLLHVTDEFIGFIICEPGPTDERIYQALSIHISTALSGAILIDKLDQSYKKLVEQAHRQGMADITTGILHNIRNVLNSINASTQLVKELVNATSMEDFIKANKLLEENMDCLDRFIRKDPRGKKLMSFYLKLGNPLYDMQDKLKYHVQRLRDKIVLVNEILTAQQSYAGIKVSLEEVGAIDIVEDALKMNMASLEKYSVKVQKNYAGEPVVMVQRAKLFHILVNLIKNAKEALMETPEEQRNLTLAVEKSDNWVYIRIIDTGCGIAPDMQKSIFAYGYTTKKDGHGFGLHSCGNYMTEMEGKIWVESEGIGKGAAFVLKLKSNDKSE